MLLGSQCEESILKGVESYYFLPCRDSYNEFLVLGGIYDDGLSLPVTISYCFSAEVSSDMGDGPKSPLFIP